MLPPISQHEATQNNFDRVMKIVAAFSVLAVALIIIGGLTHGQVGALDALPKIAGIAMWATGTGILLLNALFGYLQQIKANNELSYTPSADDYTNPGKEIHKVGL